MSYSRLTLTAMFVLCLVALLVQIVVGLDSVNLAAACLAFSSSTLVIAYLMWTPALQTHPLSTFALLGFCVTTQMGALLGQSLFGIAMAENLRDPLGTFGWLLAFQLVALTMHVFYRAILSPARSEQTSMLRNALDRLGLYTPPGTGTLWFLGYVGLVAFVLGGSGQGVFAKTLQGMAFLTWAPFLIPMYVLQFGRAYCRWSRQVVHLAFFGLLIVLLGLAANSRAVMLSGFMTVSLFALLLLLHSESRVRWSRVGQAFVGLAVLGAIAIPVSDLAAAMVVARKARGNIGPVQMVQETWRIYGQPDVIEADLRAREARTTNNYDEHYFNNVLLARLVETKFHDTSLHFVSTFSLSDRDELAQRTWELFITVLPQPVIDRLGIDLDKRDHQYSMGDLFAHLSVGGPLGGYRTGSMVAHGLGLLGPAYLALYALLCLCAFALLDLLSFRRAGGVVLVSAVGMLSLWDLFLGGLSADSVHAWVIHYLRYQPQNIVIFLLLAGFARTVAWVFSGLRPPTPARMPAPRAYPG